MSIHGFRLLSCAAVVGALGLVYGAEDTVWTGAAGDGLWSTVGNWTGGLPSESAGAVVENGGVARLQEGDAYTVSGLCVGNTEPGGVVVQTGGSLTLKDSSTRNVSLSLGHGENIKGDSRYELQGGTLVLEHYGHIGRHSRGTLLISGGTMTARQWFSVGRYEQGVGEVVISGGTFVQSANGTIIGECGIGSLTVEKGGVYSSMQPLRVGESGAYHPDAECVVRLAAGGTLMASLIHDGHTPAQEVHTGVVEFDGGTLVVAGISADVPDFIHDLKALRVKEGGVLFDTRANTAGVAMDFTGDSENGGFVKLGSGRLTLSGANTWTGRTIVSNGTLVVASPASLPGWDEPSRVFLCRNTAVEFGAGWTAEQIAAAQANFAHEQVADAEYDTQGGEITVTESLALEGGISKLGAGTLTLLGENAYADALTVWGGLLRADWGVGLDALRPLVLRGGTYAPVNGNAVTDRLGDGAGEISLYEGTASGFSAKGTPLHVSLQTGAPANALVWGASDFSPTALVLNGAEADADITLENPIDLNGHADAMVSVAAQTATLAGGVTDSSGLGVGALTKSGAGTLVFGAGAENDFPQYVHDGGTTVFPAGAKSRFDQLTGKWGPVRVEGGELDVEAFLFFYANGRYVQSGGAVTCPSVMLGGWESTGSAEIRGGSFVQSAAGDALVVGENGHGAFDVYAGGTATVAGTLEIGRVSTGSGLVNVHEGGVLGAARIRGKNGLWKEFALQPGATLVAEGEGRDDAFVDGLDSFHAARGATLDTNGRDVTVKLPTAKALVIPRAVLTHRWSFNGGLEDSVGGRTATMDGGAAFLENGRAVRLPGGEHGAGAIDLGSNLLPSEGDVTIEIWATQQGAHHWSRVLEIGSSITDAMLMAWTAGTDVNADDFCIKTSNGGHDYWSLLAPYTLGTEFHLALTFARRDDGLWDMKVYKQDATTGETLKSLAFTTSEGWSPATQNQSNFYLGRSHSAMDHDANADYNEVRIWNTALTEAELAESARAGADSAMGGGLTKKGAGELALVGTVAGYDFDVREGSLALGALNLHHRWSFNGDLTDSAGGRTAMMDGGAAFSQDGTRVQLPGGAHGAGAVDLGANLLPSEGDVSIELWATQQSVHNWSRVLEIGSCNTDALLMAWTAAEEIDNDDFCIKQTNGGKDYYRYLAPYTPGTEFHLALTFARRTDGLWDVKVYKQDATTGETLKSLAFTTSEGWSPATQNQAHFYLGRSLAGGDQDANADYNEVRIWNTALTEAQLTALAVAGPDALPTDLNHGVAAGCESATVALVEGTTLNVVNATTVKTLSGAGTVKGGALTAEIHPEGTLTVAAGATLAGTVYLDAAASGVCDRLVYAGACDVTGLSLALEPEAVLSGSAPYEVMTFPPNAFTGPFASATLPKGWNLHVNEAAGVVRLARDGFVIILR